MSGTSGSATFDIVFSYEGVPTANGQFSFSTALLGQVISASELTSFTITFDSGANNEATGTFSPLSVGSAPIGSQYPYPYFEFNSATDLLAPYQTSMLVLSGGTSVDNGAGEVEFQLLENQPAFGGIYLGHILAHGSNFEYGSFDTIAITQEPACFVAGTRVLTQSGDIAVERLAAGEMVARANGEFSPVRWIGRRSYAGRFLTANPNVQPIRFRAESLGNDLPCRDLLVSPEHAMFLDGVLVPAKALVNGSSIVQERGLERVDYFHVELEQHSVILAEGAPSESFLDDGNRGQFHNAAEHVAMYPDAPAAGERCAPMVDSGTELEAIRARLAEVTGAVSLAA